MTWAANCTAPSLDHLAFPVIEKYIQRLHVHSSDVRTNPQVVSYVHGFILGTDKALRAYSDGRRLLLDYLDFENGSGEQLGSESGSAVLFHALSEFETCITTVKKCLSFAERMASHPENPEIEKTVRRLLESYHRSVRPIRNAIEHMDTDIARGETEPGVPVMLVVSEDCEFLEIGRHRLGIGELSDCLVQLHSMAMGLSSRNKGAEA